MSPVDLARAPPIADLRQRVRAFVDTHAIPCEAHAHVHNPVAMDAALAALRPIARACGLYLPQLPQAHGGLGLTWVQRAALLEESGRSYLGPGALNCAAPDQPNMISPCCARAHHNSRPGTCGLWRRARCDRASP